MGTPPPSPIALDIVESFVIPLGTLVVSLLFTLWITSANRLEQQRDQQRQRDQHFVDNFLRETENLYGVTFVEGPVHDRTVAVETLRASFRRLASFASGSARGELGNALNESFNTVQDAFMDALKLESRHRNEQYATPSVSRFGETTSVREQIEAASRALDEMRNLARDWPDLTRRRLILRRISARAISQWPEPPTDVELAIDRHLLAMMPSRSRIQRGRDRLSVERRRLIDDWRYHRVGQRVLELASSLREERLFRRMQRQMSRATGQQLKEDRYLRRLYELASRHYARTGQPNNLQFPRNVDILDALYLTPPGEPETF